MDDCILCVGGVDWRVRLSDPHDISIPIDFGDDQPEAFGLPAASARPFTAGDFVGAVAAGGPVNCYGVTLWPHGNGTHTETVGHITEPVTPVGRALVDTLTPACLLTVEVCALDESRESYPAPGDGADLVITAGALEAAREALAPEPTWLEALVIRTRPNHPGKKHAQYSGQNPAYLTVEAMRWVRAHGVRHLLVDVPSVDREEDRGALVNHRAFWQIPPGVTDAEAAPDTGRTITEMIYAPGDLEDGRYVLNLQVPDFILDAAPSRPRLLAVTRR